MVTGISLWGGWVPCCESKAASLDTDESEDLIESLLLVVLGSLAGGLVVVSLLYWVVYGRSRAKVNRIRD